MSRKETVKSQKEGALEDSFLLDLVESADSVQDIKAIADQPGGKELVRLLLKDVVSNVMKLASSYSVLTHTEMIALGAQLNERLALAKLIMNAADKEKELDQAIADALAE